MHRPRQILLLLTLMFALALALVVTGCKDQLPAELTGLADENSVARLAVLPPDTNLLLSLHSSGVLGSIPDLGPGGRELGRFGPTALVLVNRARVAQLTKTPGLEHLVLWGDEKSLNRMGPMLRNDILSGMASDSWPEIEYAAVGEFVGTGPQLKQSLLDEGAEVGSSGGGVVTLTATCEVLFNILARDDLRQLKKSNLQGTAHRLNRN